MAQSLTVQDYAKITLTSLVRYGIHQSRQGGIIDGDGPTPAAN